VCLNGDSEPNKPPFGDRAAIAGLSRNRWFYWRKAEAKVR